MRGIFLSVVLLFSIALILIPHAYAEDITVSSIGLDETVIVEFTNESN